MGNALRIADRSYVLPVFLAREEPLPGVDSSLVCDAARRSGAHCSQITLNQIEELLKSTRGGVLIFMGAGSVDGVARRLLLEVGR